MYVKNNNICFLLWSLSKSCVNNSLDFTREIYIRYLQIQIKLCFVIIRLILMLKQELFLKIIKYVANRFKG